jgi:intracellular sulfur oxidation DsrE/DsrF family protein
MTIRLQSLLTALAIALAAVTGAAAENAKPHRVAIQIDQSDEKVTNMVLNNAKNVLEHYRAKNEDAEVEIVAYGPGLDMLRDDKSPVKDRIKQMVEVNFPSKIAFSACNNTKQGMEKREGHPITLIPQATIVPAGVVRLMELQEQGWSYVRP